jgi:site-specific recombinase
VGSLGTQPELTRRLPHLESSESPFLVLSDRVIAYTLSYRNDIDGDEPPLLADALLTIRRCRDEVAQLRATKSVHGTSLRLTGDTFRLLQLLDRLELLLELTAPAERDTQSSLIELFRETLRAEKTRDQVGVHVRERADLLIFQVVEHAAKKGSKYITSGRGDYLAFFRASLQGGFIVACFSLAKTLIEGWGLPLGAEAILFGLNYSACFVGIYVTGSALATKQPAMTANTIARALGDPNDRGIDRLEALVVRVWRSQFASFVGNLMLALPTAFVLSEAFYRWRGRTVADEAKALELLEALHPLQSGSILYAAVAGLFLFSAGLVSGWVDNRNLYSQIPKRVEKHPLLKRVAGAERARGISAYVDRHLGAITGNVFLGFALGSTGTLGDLLGLPLDIRHIAFAAAELGTGLEIMHLQVPAGLAWQAALGVALIGLVNFLVSFGLSLAMALESRRVTWGEVRHLVRHLGRSFRSRPLAWFLPPGKHLQS